MAGKMKPVEELENLLVPDLKEMCKILQIKKDGTGWLRCCPPTSCKADILSVLRTRTSDELQDALYALEKTRADGIESEKAQNDEYHEETRQRHAAPQSDQFESSMLAMNTDASNRHWGVSSDHKLLAAVRNKLSATSADIVTMCEVSGDGVMSDLIRKTEGYTGRFGTLSGGAGDGIVTMWNPSKWEVGCDLKSAEYKVDNKKKYSAVVLKGIDVDFKLLNISCHFPHKDPNKAKETCKAILKVIEDHYDINAVSLQGDFNMKPDPLRDELYRIGPIVAFDGIDNFVGQDGASFASVRSCESSNFTHPVISGTMQFER